MRRVEARCGNEGEEQGGENADRHRETNCNYGNIQKNFKDTSKSKRKTQHKNAWKSNAENYKTQNHDI